MLSSQQLNQELINNTEEWEDKLDCWFQRVTEIVRVPNDLKHCTTCVPVSFSGKNKRQGRINTIERKTQSLDPNKITLLERVLLS